jgi:hypothetical protein
MARKTAPKTTEQNRSATRIDKQHEMVDVRLDFLTGEISGLPPLDALGQRHANQLAIELYSTLKYANGAMPMTRAIELHAILKTLWRLTRSVDGKDEAHHQYIN